jgi:phenylalanyl-tRNA synthetase beta chain
MTISYKWLHEYLPETVDPERLSQILTSIGLEVESMGKKEDIPGGLEGLLVGEVLECAPHPNADKLKITKVNVGNNETLSIVCGASNVMAGQKVIVAPIGATIYPVSGEPLKMKKAKIRGEESNGMICAEDEIGLGTNHDGIMVLDPKAVTGTPAKAYFQITSDWIYEIGLTPNRMDAMSHLGVARDVIAYLNYHDKRNLSVVTPLGKAFQTDKKSAPVSVEIVHSAACKRYAGITIEGITVKESPEWLKKRLQSIGQKPINNVVDVTNFILHETGQPLHAFDVSAISGHKIIVRSANTGEQLITLDGKKRELNPEDLLICNEKEAMCIAGVFGGEESGVKNNTTTLFLESAWFEPRTIRKTSFRHQLRTDAASRFEKGVDISNTVNVLKRAATLIVELAGGKLKGEVIDVYPQPQEKKELGLRFHYLKRLSGKNYHPDAVKKSSPHSDLSLSKKAWMNSA